MKRILVYDLNKTLYRKSSKNEFFKFLCSRRPKICFSIFGMLYSGLVYSLDLKNKTWFKDRFYRYLNGLKPKEVQKLAKQYWKREFPEQFRTEFLDEIKSSVQNGIEVYVVTGAYEIYVKYLETILPVNVIGTRAEYRDGKYHIIGKACNDEEKVRRLEEHIRQDFVILKSYSDDDEAILYEAEEGYFLQGDSLIQVNKKRR
ncbi:haloacid dehalogenase-like hydrolase [Gramella sp. BOM4]|nr:haloacid dehalogenase-like hydrolase [Christiangramia bathymodioli]